MCVSACVCCQLSKEVPIYSIVLEDKVKNERVRDARTSSAAVLAGRTSWGWRWARLLGSWWCWKTNMTGLFWLLAQHNYNTCRNTHAGYVGGTMVITLYIIMHSMMNHVKVQDCTSRCVLCQFPPQKYNGHSNYASTCSPIDIII